MLKPKTILAFIAGTLLAGCPEGTVVTRGDADSKQTSPKPGRRQALKLTPRGDSSKVSALSDLQDNPPATGLALTSGSVSEPLAKRPAIENSPLTEQQKAVHLLSRLTYGGRPGDVKRVRSMGLERFIEQQLRSEQIKDPGVAPRLAALETIHLPIRELAQLFPRPDTVKRLVEAGLLAGDYLPGGLGDRPGNPIYRPIMRLPEPLEVPSLRGGMMFRRPPPLLGVNPRNLIVMQLQAAKLIRAVHSERQLEEVMADFWMNHFNVFMAKGPEYLYVPSYERDVIRPHALGKFRDLLGATAESPAMMFYLDNVQSVSPQTTFGRFHKRGLNENYARELLELHTLGVDGGYTQRDVIEVARVFTGWTLFGAPGEDASSFQFRRAGHAPGDKQVLGRVIREGEADEAEQVLDLLARHPSTAKFIATKLVRRFVADEPPRSLVNQVAATYMKADGDIRAVLRTIFYSPEFWAREAFQAKAKKPLELVASTIRAAGGELTPTPALLGTMQRLGEPLYLCQPPTGYPDVAAEWLNTGTLLYRWNFALQVANGKVPGVKIPAREDLNGGNAATVLARLSDDLLHGEMSPETRAVVASMLEDQLSQRKDPDTPLKSHEICYVAGLMLGSPEFQRR